MQKKQEMTRRTFLAVAGGTLISIGLPGVFMTVSDAKQLALAADLRPDGRPRLPPGQIAVEKIRDMGGTPGTATPANWSLQVYGEVKKPIHISYPELLKLDQVNITCDIHCVTGWTLLDSQWRGVRLSTVLEKAKLNPNGHFIIFSSPGGYTTSIPISEAGKEKVILAHSLYGEPLPQAHGAPVRGLVPDRYLYKSAKWVEAIKVVAQDAPGYWETQGYSNSADPWKEERYQ